MSRVLQGVALAATALFGAGVAVGRNLWPKDDEPKPTGPIRDDDLERHVHQQLFDTLLSTTADSIERSRSGAQFIQVAAGAVSGLYAGALGLVFAVGTNPLPLRGFAPTMFLAASIGFSAFYLAFLTRGREANLRETTDPVSSPKHALADATVFVGWVQEAVTRRVAFLRAAVVSLAIGVALLPLPFLSVADEWVEWLPGAIVGAQTSEQGAAAEPSPLVLPEPQLAANAWPAEVQAIAYQARVDRYLKSLDKPAPATDGAENALALWTTVLGIVMVGVTFVFTWANNAYHAKQERTRQEEVTRNTRVA